MEQLIFVSFVAKRDFADDSGRQVQGLSVQYFPIGQQPAKDTIGNAISKDFLNLDRSSNFPTTGLYKGAFAMQANSSGKTALKLTDGQLVKEMSFDQLVTEKASKG